MALTSMASKRKHNCNSRGPADLETAAKNRLKFSEGFEGCQFSARV